MGNGGRTSFKSNNSIKQALNRRITVKSGNNSYNRFETGALSGMSGGSSANKPNFCPAPFLMNIEKDENVSRSDKMMDDELLDKQSYNSGSLGAMQAANQGQQAYMNMLSH